MIFSRKTMLSKLSKLYLFLILYDSAFNLVLILGSTALGDITLVSIIKL